MSVAPRERPEIGVSTAPPGINGEGQPWKELDQGQHREGLAHRRGAESGRWPPGLLVPEKLLSHTGAELQSGSSRAVKRQPPLPGTNS